MAHFRPLSVIFCTFVAHFRAIFTHFGHFPSIYDPFSAISVIVWSLSAIVGNFWPCVAHFAAHFAAHLCQCSTIFDQFGSFYVQLRPKCDQFRPFEAHFRHIFRPFSGIFGPFSTNLVHFRYNCGHSATRFGHLRTIFIFGTFLSSFGCGQPFSAYFRPIYGATLAHISTFFGPF